MVSGRGVFVCVFGGLTSIHAGLETGCRYDVVGVIRQTTFYFILRRAGICLDTHQGFSYRNLSIILVVGIRFKLLIEHSICTKTAIIRRLKTIYFAHFVHN